MAAEAVKVAVRCWPLSGCEVALGCWAVVGVDGTGPVPPAEPCGTRGDPRLFSFDGAFGGEQSSEHIYDETAYLHMEGLAEGYNGAIFAYSQTGSGKSFTMQGAVDPSSQKGIIPRAFEHIFESVQCAENAKFLLRASHLESYNEDIQDLLGADTKQKLERESGRRDFLLQFPILCSTSVVTRVSMATQSALGRQELGRAVSRLKEQLEQGVSVKGLSVPVAQCEQLMDTGCRTRAVPFTLVNKGCSRSHCTFPVGMGICTAVAT